MEEVRQLVQEEGREARNLVAFHVAVDTPTRLSRKPPRAVPPTRRAAPRAVRLRSASAGRDKRSDMRARYWALLFGDLHRSVGEIYNFVEANENLSECQEVILVLENYTRDFKALGEWFRLKWEYDNTPPPQRPQSLAWEIRKTDFVRLDFRRAYSVKSSPSVSGKNSPCLSGHNTPSGKNSPNLTGKASPGSGKISPRISSTHSNTSPKANIEFFSNKIVASKITAKPEPKAPKESPRLSDIKEKDLKDTENIQVEAKLKPETDNLVQKIDLNEDLKKITVEVGKAMEIPNASPKAVVIKSPKRAKLPTAESPSKKSEELTSQAKATIAQLDAMENAFLEKQIVENVAKNENMINQDKEFDNNLNQQSNESVSDECDSQKPIENAEEKPPTPTESPTKSEDNFADVSNESSPKSVADKPPDVILHAGLNETKNGGSVEQPEIVKDTLNDVHKEKQNDDSAVTAKDEPNDSTEEKEKIEEEKIQEEIKEPVKDAEVTPSNTSVVTEDQKKEQDFKKSDIKTVPDSKPNTRPAYSTAAAKPKPVSAIKTDVKPPVRTALARSSTVVEIRPSSASKTQKPFQRKNQTSKCSYPFNLTTGRKSLFDNSPSVPNKAPIVKRPFSRNTQMASGDNKMTPIKADLKKRPPRPTSLKINEKGDKKTKIEKNNLALQRIKDCEEYSSCDTVVTQIDMSRIDSSESLKTLVPEDMQDVGNSIEVLAVDDKKDNEGWLTVKSKRCTRESKKQSKSHWANRFHQPSATTSLPTLNMLVSPKQETKSLTDAPTVAKTDRAQSEQPQRYEKPATKVVKVDVKPEDTEPKKVEKQESKLKVEVRKRSQEKSKDPAMIRQKSDVTGLKTRSSRSKVLTKRAEKVKDAGRDDGYSDLTKNRLHSSLESLTTGLARSQESTEDTFDFDKWKAEFKSTFNFLDDDDQISDQNELLMSADPSEMSEIAEMTSQIEENERKISLALDFQCEVDQRKLCEEEDLLNRQIMELQQVSDVDLDTETDDTETDAEIVCEDPIPVAVPPENLASLTASLEDQYETALAGMSWAERMDALYTLEALVARDPGRAQQLHSKLSQGIRRRGSLQDVLRRIQAKQARADRQRQQLRTERANKIHQLLARVEEVKLAKNQLTEEKRLRMERRLQKAAENRDQHLKDRVRKAHDEEEKLREIAFIKQLQAENRRHDFLAQCRAHTTRLRQRRREQLKKLEDKAAREAAVGARRQAIQEARQQHVALLLERRRERDARVEELKELKRQERDDAAREKVCAGGQGRRERDARVEELKELKRQERDDAAREKVCAGGQGRRERDARVEELKELKRQERDDAAREKVCAGGQGRRERDARVEELKELKRQERDDAAREKVCAGGQGRRERDARVEELKELKRQERDDAAREKVCAGGQGRRERDARVEELKELKRQERDDAAREKVCAGGQGRRERDARVEELKELKRQERDDAAREKVCAGGQGRRERDARVEELKELKRQERDDAAREKVCAGGQGRRERDARVEELKELKRQERDDAAREKVCAGGQGRRERDARVEELKELKRQERDDAAREKVCAGGQGRRERDARVEELKELKRQERDDAAREKVCAGGQGRREKDARVEELKELKRQERDDAAREKVCAGGQGRRERDARVEELKELKRQERDDAAREKAEGVKSRLSALAAAAKQEEAALRSRIRDKQDASQQRLESHLQAIREKATGPRQATTSESHDQAARDVEEAERIEQERRDREKQKAIKKKARKLKQKLLASGNTRAVYEDNTTVMDAILNPYANKITKIVNIINNITKPLQEDEEKYSIASPKENGLDFEEQKTKKKNKKVVNGIESQEMNGDKKKKVEVEHEKIINGGSDTESNQEKKKKKKSKSSEREIETEQNNNNDLNTETKSKKKKKKSESERRLTKTSSVCSSLSDMSRSSGREKKATVTVDVTYLERQLNELHRIVEKLAAKGEQRAVYKTIIVKTVSQVLTVAAEREDLASQFTARCLTTTVTILSRVLAACSVSALHAVTTNTCVHLIKLLSDQLDKDLTADPKEMELARQLTDCLSVALDSVLCSTRIYEEKQPQARRPDDQDMLATLRNRAHMLISYFCLCGCIARAEKAGEVRESIQTLLTVCADLCHPCDADIGSERQSAKQSLRCALGRGVFGSRAEFCMLFEKGAELAQCGDFVRAARTAHLLRAVAEMDHQVVQEAFGEGGWPLEFRAAVARLLSQHAPHEKEAPRAIALRLSNQRLDQTLSETMVLDLIVLVGFVVVNNPQLQETICDNWSVIKTLCTLPANWLHGAAHAAALLPALRALADAPAARAAIAAELNMQIIEEFMESPEAQKLKLVQVIKQGKSKKPGKK